MDAGTSPCCPRQTRAKCHATHKLERTQQEQTLEAVELKGLEDRREDESGYLSDTDCDDR